MKILPVRSTCGTPSPGQSICRPEELLFLHPYPVPPSGAGHGCAAEGRCCRCVGPAGCSSGEAPCLCARGRGGAEERRTERRWQGGSGVRGESWEEAER